MQTQNVETTQVVAADVVNVEQVASTEATVKTATKKTARKVSAVRAAVVPVVSAKTKMVFLKIAKANGVTAQAATIANLAAKKLGGFEAPLREFAKNHVDAKVWSSRVATVQPKHLERAAMKQTAFWQRVGYTVINPHVAPTATAENTQKTV